MLFKISVGMTMARYVPNYLIGIPSSREHKETLFLAAL